MDARGMGRGAVGEGNRGAGGVCGERMLQLMPTFVTAAYPSDEPPRTPRDRAIGSDHSEVADGSAVHMIREVEKVYHSMCLYTACGAIVGEQESVALYSWRGDLGVIIGVVGAVWTTGGSSANAGCATSPVGEGECLPTAIGPSNWDIG
eukprot:689868-Prymnesium_polylepis.1